MSQLKETRMAVKAQSFPETSCHLLRDSGLGDKGLCPELHENKMGECFLPPAPVTLLPRHKGTDWTPKGGNPCLHTSGPQDGPREIPRVGMSVAS